ncbi:unnamed protein product, partial [marine sediment metagenome]
HEDNKAMNDVVLGAILGGASAAVGAGITGFLLYKSVKLQLRASRADLELRLGNQGAEARRTRLIEARKGYLVDLSKAISNWVESDIQETNMSVRWEESRRRGEPDLENSARALSKAMNEAKDWTSEVRHIRGRISDETLDRLIEGAETMMLEVDAARRPIIRVFNAEEVDMEALGKAFEEERMLMGRVRDHLLRANKRIEELLSGDEAQ